MELSKENQLMELVVSTRATTSYHDLLEAQYFLFQTQIEKLQNIVATQCKLTGANPLSQEMAAGALSIKIGKRPRDLLNPKAVKYMQFIFSIKDAISKRETREISAHFGVTATQVREFFAGQRSRVRKFVRLSTEKADSRLSTEKADRSNTCNDMHEGIPSTSDHNMAAEPVPLDTILPIGLEEGPSEGPSSSMQTEFSFGKEKSDRQFIYNIFRLMRNEESFSGQVKLLEWILQMQKTSVLHWFLTEGGVMILATWLSQAAMEEQTSVLHVILKVLCHLPLNKALPVHMSAILQSVNRLRFYRASDISNRARTLLSRWSKMFANSQISSNPNGIKSVGDAQDEMLLKQSINEVMAKETWDSNVDNSEVTPKLSSENPDNFRMLESRQKLKLLTAPGEDSNKRRGVLSSHMRERRKVKMVEHPGQRIAVNSPHVAKPTLATQSRPLSADDIQKAKIRAQYMQSRYRKSDDNAPAKPESELKCISSQSSVLLTIPKSVQPDHDEKRKLDNALLKVSNVQETDQSNLEEQPPWKKYRRIQIPWQTPPALEIRATWLVGTGENSKEVEVQKNRIRRDREIIYRTIQEIPSNPREPWDCEMDHDDTLTPEIPIEQLPDVEPLETPQVSVNDSKESVVGVAPTTSHGDGGSVPEPDLELLAELLKNPQLVFALTSGQAGDLSSNQTVKLLDMIKNNGVTSLSNLAGVGGKADNKVEVSLPSPTPSSDPVPNGMKPDFSRNPFSRQHTMANGGAYRSPGTALPVRPQETILASTLVQPHIPGTSILTTRRPPVSSLQSSMQLPEQWQLPTNPSVHHSSPAQHLAPEMMLNMNTVINRTSPNLLGASSPMIPVENFSNANRSPASAGIPLGRLVPTPTPVTLLPQTQPQQPYAPEPTVSHSLRARPGYDSINYHSNNPSLNSYNVYTGGPVRAAASTWERNELGETPDFESWSPDNSPRRHYEYIPGRKYPEPRVNLRHEHGPERERAMPRNMVQPSGYWDQSRGGAGNKRSRDNRR